MPPVWEALLAIGIGLGIAAALVAVFCLVAWLAERHADRQFPKFLRDIERHQGEQPWNTV
jgi:uncharacterized membrane protein YphA (DoxX/SURF4 family)